MNTPFTASLLTHMGGLWAFLAIEMPIEFLAPVYVGDTVSAEAMVAEVHARSGRVVLHCRCTNRAGQDVLRAKISGFPGRFAAGDEAA
jgi:acyl dehydratase